MKDTLEILRLRFQVFLSESLICVSEGTGKVFNYTSKFRYLYLMNDYKRTDYRNLVAAQIRELKSKDDPNMELAIERVSELYKWMCDNQ
jgi:hypothetical protein